MSDEIWKPIPSLFGFYSASNMGNIKRNERKVFDKWDRPRYWPEVHIKPRINTGGYLDFCVSLNGHRKSMSVHRAVCEAFLGFMQNGLSVNHIDGDKLNNRLGNLEYVTFQENIKHAFKSGLMKKARGESRPTSILTSLEVGKIKGLLMHFKKGDSLKISRYFDVAPATILNIKNRTTWDFVQPTDVSVEFAKEVLGRVPLGISNGGKTARTTLSTIDAILSEDERKEEV